MSWWGLRGKSPEAARAAAYFTGWTLSCPRRSRSWIQASRAQANVPFFSFTSRHDEPRVHSHLQAIPEPALLPRRHSSSWCCRTHFIANRQLFSSSCSWIHMCVCARMCVCILWPCAYVRLPVCTAAAAAVVVGVCLSGRQEMKETKESERAGYSEVVFHCQSERKIIPLPGSFFSPSSHQELEIWTSSGPR